MAARNATVAVVAKTSTSDSSQPSSCQPDPDAKAPAQPASKLTSPALSMTAAMKNMGTNTPLKEHLSQTETATVIQNEEKQILRRLNENLTAQSPAEEELLPPTEEPTCTPQENQSVTDKHPPLRRDQKKREIAEPSVLSVAQQTGETSISTVGETFDTSLAPVDRLSSGGDSKNWVVGDPGVMSVAQQTLEKACVRTSGKTLGEVIQMNVLQSNTPRKVWGMSPASQLLRVLQEAISGTPNEFLPLELRSSAGVQSPKVQEEGAAVKDVSHLEVSEASAVARQTLPSSLTETQDPSDVESMVMEEGPNLALQGGVQQACEQEAQQRDAYEDELRYIGATVERLLLKDKGFTQTSPEDGVPNGSGEEEAGGRLTNVVGDENHSSDSENDEDWLSDGSEEDDGEDTEEHDRAIALRRQEELRSNLGQQMGSEKFIEVYNKIKAILEDEDEAINLSSSLILSILGSEHQHLRLDILHLVFLDCVYQDNDE